MWQENEGDGVRRQEMQERMHALFGPQAEATEEVNGMRQEILDWCEQGELTAGRLAERFSRFSMAEQLLAGLDRQVGSATEDGAMLSEVLKYHADGETLELSIVLNNYTGDAAWAKVMEGLQNLAQQFRSGALPETKEVVMTSWLFTSGFRERIAQLAGGDQALRLEDADESLAEDARYLALTSNRRTLREYLTTGKLPEVKTLRVSREEFVYRFG